MDIQFVDDLACNGRTILHRALPWSKMTAAAVLLTAAILANTPLLAAAVASAVVLCAMASGQPVSRTASLALYPVAFAVLFSLGFLRSNPLFAFLIVAKAFTAGLVVATLMTTTPFVDVFGALARVMPSSVADALFMAYRAFFVLVGQFQDLLTAMKLRGGAGKGLWQQLRTYGEVLGVVILRSMDMTERMYRVMVVRGYSGPIRTVRERHAPSGLDYAVLAYSAAVFIGVLILR